MNNESKCPGHNRAECVSCCWPTTNAVDTRAIDAAIRDAIVTGTGAYEVFGCDYGIEIRHVPDIREHPKKSDESAAGYTAVDMTTAAAQGFRDGAASVVVELPEMYFTGGNGSIRLFDADQVKSAIIAAGGRIKE